MRRRRRWQWGEQARRLARRGLDVLARTATVRRLGRRRSGWKKWIAVRRERPRNVRALLDLVFVAAAYVFRARGERSIWERHRSHLTRTLDKVRGRRS